MRGGRAVLEKRRRINNDEEAEVFDVPHGSRRRAWVEELVLAGEVVVRWVDSSNDPPAAGLHRGGVGTSAHGFRLSDLF